MKHLKEKLPNSIKPNSPKVNQSQSLIKELSKQPTNLRNIRKQIRYLIAIIKNFMSVLNKNKQTFFT